MTFAEKSFAEKLASNRRNAIWDLAKRMFDSYNPNDLRRLWCSIHCGEEPFSPLNGCTDAELIEISESYPD